MPIITNIYQLSDFTGFINDTTTTTGTGAGRVDFSENPAAPVSFTVSDDDDFFDDAYVEQGATGSYSILTSDVTLNGTTYLAADNHIVELEYSATMTDGTIFYVIRIGGVNVGVITSSPIEADDTFFLAVPDGFNDGVSLAYDTICFARDTLIQTKSGNKNVQDIKVGDLVLNRAGQFVPVKWTGKQSFSKIALRQSPKLRPVVISAGALGVNTPSVDLVVTQQHRVFLTDWRAELLFGFSEFLTPAKALLNDTTITLAPIENDVEYFHIMFDQHEIINSNGQWTESFFPGEQAIGTLDLATQEELYEIFPELREDDPIGRPMAAPCLKPFEMRALTPS